MNPLKTQEQLDNLKREKDALLLLFGGANCGVCQVIKPQISEKFTHKFLTLEMIYIDCEQQQEICAQHGVFSLPVVHVFFMGQKFIEEVRGFSLLALEQKIEQVFIKMKS
ncbi:thioredoxin family protein [Bathymodiolus septemdierum thioautotrophic gill symbiont]|uniref:Thioredoxin domain protein n=1 Tax=endosymbiont of Bathymodiolus septemdierum str. Myojin knoll TaxID=1303921 RepID=A0A0P0UTP5_9GAMM|nr:thioredoxin family protein [Bathymodiolus septemdierum thioautotrophic gill symbiont]BAS68286.1 thioredoxin domain protein [endosymbiont of Bathymodiolus septemdierum str. Myojin knoll]